MMSREHPQLRVRIPQEMKDYLEVEAKKNSRTLTAEITHRLQNTIDQESKQINNNNLTNDIHETYHLIDFSSAVEKIADVAKLLQSLNDLTPEQEGELLTSFLKKQKKAPK